MASRAGGKISRLSGLLIRSAGQIFLGGGSVLRRRECRGVDGNILSIKLALLLG